MTVDLKPKGRPRDDSKRLAIETLLASGMKPDVVRKGTGASLTLIYEVRRGMRKKGGALTSNPQESPLRDGDDAENGEPILAQGRG